MIHVRALETVVKVLTAAVHAALILEVAAGSERNAIQWVLGFERGDAGFVRDQRIESLQKASATGHDNSSLDNIGREFRRRLTERSLYFLDDRIDRLLQSLTHFDTVDLEPSRKSGNGIGALHFHFF